MILVVDASVAVKWFVYFKPDEEDADIALAILERVTLGGIYLVQPAHFTAEVAAFLARSKPASAAYDLLQLMRCPKRVLDSAQIYATAIELATTLQHHLFDTLYHAAALQTPGCTLVTADKIYYRKAKTLGQIQLLEDFEFA